MKKLKLKQNEVVHCATLKQAKKVLKISYKLGLKGIGGIALKTNYWNNYKEKTVFYLNSGQYGNIDLVVEGYEIITSKEFIKRHKKKSKYKKLEDRINILEAIVNATNESVTIIKSEEAIEENKYISEEQKEQIKKYSQPQIGDVVKAWDDDKSKFVYGVLVSIDKESLYPYEVGSICTQNIEKVTEISINDFRK